MRRWISFIFSIWLTLGCLAVDYQPKKAVYGSPGYSYGYAQEAPTAVFRSTSSYSTEVPTPTAMRLQRPEAIGSMSAISASNFAELNSEEGWCGGTSARANIRKGRPGGGGGGGGGAIGEYEFHSPVGNTPWMIMALLAAAYLLVKRRKARAEE